MPDWRAILGSAGITVHSACDTLPMLSDKELDGIAGSIERNGLRVMLELWRAKEADPWQLVSGRNRCAAMARLDGGEAMILGSIGCAIQRTGGDPFVLVADLDHRRRHMTPDQKRDAIARLIEADPSRSNRSVAREVASNHHTVERVREGLEASGTISHSTERRGEDGRVTRPAPAPRQPPEAQRQVPPPRAETAEEWRRRMREEQYAEGERTVEPEPELPLFVHKVRALTDWLNKNPADVHQVPVETRLQEVMPLVKAARINPSEMGDADD